MAQMSHKRLRVVPLLHFLPVSASLFLRWQNLWRVVHLMWENKLAQHFNFFFPLHMSKTELGWASEVDVSPYVHHRKNPVNTAFFARGGHSQTYLNTWKTKIRIPYIDCFWECSQIYIFTNPTTKIRTITHSTNSRWFSNINGWGLREKHSGN